MIKETTNDNNGSPCVRVKRNCDEFDLNSKGIMVTHSCPKCGERSKCSIHQSKDVENYKHVCDFCKKEWLQYTDEDILKHREIEPLNSVGRSN